MTIGECLSKVLKLLNYYSVAGTPISSNDGNYKDLRLRALPLMESGEFQLCGIFPILRSHHIPCLPPHTLTPQMGTILVGTSGTDVRIPTAAHSLSFRTGQPVTAAVVQTISGTESTLASVTAAPSGGVCACTAVFTPDADAEKLEVRFSGGFAHVLDFAAYQESYVSSDDVPVFGEYMRYSLPADFRALMQVNLRPALGTVQDDFRGYLLSETHLLLPWSFSGEATLIYAANPAKIADTDADTVALSVSDACGQALCYYVASGLVQEEDSGLSARFTELYRDCTARLEPSRPVCGIRCGWYRETRKKLKNRIY